MPNTTCTRCSRPLSPPVADELCETCRHHDTVAPLLRAPGDTPFLMTPAVDPDPIAPTQRISRAALPPPVLPGYDLRDTLGGGGMGVVYLAYEVDADRLVALKFVRAAADPAARERFRVEVQAMARLDHPNVVRVYAVELDRPDPFFTMEPVDGPGLDRRLVTTGPLPAAEAARIMEQVARAVQHAHDEGVVHRDLKPGNVIVGSDGVPKVTDFGLAKRTDAEDGLTVWDAVLGTPGFMAPEQTGGRNEEVGKPADVYGLGSTLYALLTGQQPFHGTDPVEVAVRVRTRPPRPMSDLRRDVPAELEAVVLKCLQKDPAKRYASAGEMADDLARWLRGERTTARPPSRVVRLGRAVSRRRSTVMAGLVPFLALFVVSGGSSSPPAGRPADPDPVAAIRQTLAVNRPVELVGMTGEPRYHRWVIGNGHFQALEDGTVAFQNRGYAFLELCPDPGVKRYRVTAEIRHLHSAAAVSGEMLSATHRVGLYFGHDVRNGPDGAMVHTFSTLEFSDHQADPAKLQLKSVEYRDNVLVERPLTYTHRRSTVIAEAPYDGQTALPGPWRRVEVELSPDRMDVTYGLWSGSRDAAGLKARDAALRLMVGGFTPGVLLPDWSTNRPFGICVYGSSVAVRNVTVTPLPNP